MRDLFVNIAGETYATALMWIVGILVALLLLLILVRIIRALTSGTFVAGGRNRRQRLAVTDATAVDNQRRLVLVRRDEVEHLILIGGPSDIVVEQNIRPGRPAAAEPVAPVARQRTPTDPQPAPPREQPRPTPAEAAPAQPAAPQRAPETPRPAPAQATREAQPAPAPRQAAAPAAATATAASAYGPEAEIGSSDEVLGDFDAPADRAQEQRRPQADSELETEMSRLLEELSDDRK